MLTFFVLDIIANICLIHDIKNFFSHIFCLGVDTQMKFTLDPMPGELGFVQWKDAMKALARLPGGIPKEFRKSVNFFSFY